MQHLTPLMKARVFFALTSFWAALPVSGQEPFDVRGTKDQIQKAYQERHYPLKVTFKVVDLNGTPLEGAKINVGVDSLVHADGYNNYKGRTDANGLFTVEARGRGCSDVLVEKDEYYPSRPEYKWSGELNPGGSATHEAGGLRPWNPIIRVVMKEVGNPIPMIVRREFSGVRAGASAPVLEEQIEWDLVVADWLPPHGTGKHADLTFVFTGSYVGKGTFSASMKMEFINKHDGLMPILQLFGPESRLKFPRVAPKEGYHLKSYDASLRVVDFEVVENEPDQRPKGYFIRFRTKVNESGEVISAMYGKLTTPITLDFPSAKPPRPSFRFSSYINPSPNDRNLEYDQITNLAPDAPDGVTWEP